MVRSTERTRKILQIVLRTPVQTQEELVQALRAVGIRVTQATVSRDIKRLGLVKVPVNGGRYRYARPEAVSTPAPNAEERLRSTIDEFATSVETAVHLILVKTLRGGAAPVAQAIDDMRWVDVAGTLAGEDTIIVVPRNKAAARVVAERLRSLLP